MNAQIEGRVAVVTGGSSGIGFETLRLLLGEGAKVAFCGRNPDRLASAHAALQNEYPGAEVFSYRCDVLKEDEVQAFADAVAARFGGADMLINNAGQGYVAHFADTPREAWLHEAELKLFGVINPVKAFQPQLEWSAYRLDYLRQFTAGATAGRAHDCHLRRPRGAAQHDADAVKRFGSKRHSRQLDFAGNGGVGAVAAAL